MKKIYAIMFSVLTLGLASCDMDKTPYDAIPDTEALQSYTDFVNMRTGLYSPLRGVNTGTYLLATELMADNFNAVVGFSNTYGVLHRWQQDTQSGEFETIWGGFQTLISRANYIIDYSEKVDLTDEELFDADQVKEIRQIIGEAYFIRAYAIFNLAQFFCADFEAKSAGEANSGVAFSLHYAPTSDNSQYPARATLADTYAQIKSDIDAAKPLIPTEPTSLNKANPQAYISQDVITALEARVALAMDDYATAAAKAVQLISSDAYALCADADELIEMWQNDNTPEAIWQLPIPSANELASQTGSVFLPYTEGSTPDYIPSGDLLSVFSRNDYRVQAYFKVDQLNTTNGTSGYVYEFNKYADKTTAVYERLGTENSRFQNEPKVFRIAEMYLIAAEAYAQAGNVSEAAKYLNDLQANRFADFIRQDYSSTTELMNEIKDERRRELLGEGTRLFDLKRWHQGVSRTSTQQDDLCLFPGSSITTNLVKSANDPKMIFPIPKAETDANPQIVQNPGY